MEYGIGIKIKHGKKSRKINYEKVKNGLYLYLFINLKI